MTLYGITIQGCDDSTKFNVELSREQFDVMAIVCAESSKASDYGCQPTISIHPRPHSKDELE